MNAIKLRFIAAYIFRATVLITLLFAATSSFAAIPGYTKNPESISVVMDDNYPPYVFKNDQGQLKGITVDQWILWEKKTGIHVEITGTNWDEAQRKMQAGEFNVIDTIFRNENREKIYDFTKPYAVIPVPIFFHSDISGISEPRDARGFMVAAKAGGNVLDILRKHGITNIVEYPSYEKIIEAARDGKVKVFTVDRPPALYFLNKMGIQNSFRETAPLYSGEFRRAVLKGRSDLLTIVEKGFADITPAEYRAIENKWKGTPISASPYFRYAGYTAAVLTTFVAGLLLWLRLLKRAVSIKTKELSESKERLVLALNASKSGIWDREVKTGKMYFDPNYFILSGYEPNEFPHSYDEWEKRVHPADIDQAKDAIEAYLTGKSESYNVEFRFKRKDGSWMWVLSQGQLFGRDEQGNPVRFTGMHTDISERKHYEGSLIKSESYYRSLFDSSLLGVTVTNREFIITDANDAFCKMLEYSKDELIGKMSIADISHPDDGDKSFEMVRKLITHEIDHYSLEKRYLTKTGKIVNALIYVRGQYNLDGGYEGTTGSFLDITEYKKANESLRVSEEKYRSLFNNSDVAMFRSRVDGSEVLDVNPKFLDMFGKTLDEMIGKPSTIVWADPKDREEMIRKLLAEGRVSGYEQKLLDHQGGIKNCLTSMVLYREQGILEGSILDMTELKRAEEERLYLEKQLLHAQKLESLGVLSGGIAHDFNNILAVIMGYCALTKMDYKTAENNILEIEKAAERASGLCRQMLAYAGKAQLNKTQVNIGMLVDEMVTMLKSTLPLNAVIKPDLSTNIPLIDGDANQLRQIVMNLIINASEAIGNVQGEIRVSLAKTTVPSGQSDYHGKAIRPGEYVSLEVTDNGCGMDEETKRRIFEPFYSTKFSGRGLGMSAVLGIITSHGGVLQLFSQLGQGTTFRIYLPVQISDAVGDENLGLPVLSTTWQGSGTILLVEDDDQIRYIANTLLDMFGFTVLEAANGKEALELYHKNFANITLVLTDMGMPVMDGYELVYELKKLCPTLPIIVSSGFGDVEVGSRISIDDIAGLISKPYNPDQLREVLKGVLEGVHPSHVCGKISHQFAG